MPVKITKNHRLEDDTFPSAVAMLQWINGRCGALKDTWELVGISTGSREDGKEYWVGLEFKPRKPGL